MNIRPLFVVASLLLLGDWGQKTLQGINGPKFIQSSYVHKKNAVPAAEKASNLICVLQ